MGKGAKKGIIDLTGQTFGRLTVIDDSGLRKGKNVLWRCRCECGNEKNIRSYCLRSGDTRSCGCITSPAFDEYRKRLREKVLNFSEINDSCWEWKGRICKDGYGETSYRKNSHFKAYKLSYLAFHGEIQKNTWILHSCDNRKCVNPEHLYAGDHKKNVMDMMKRNRSNKGSQRPMAKLNEEQVFFSRILNRNGFSSKLLAKIFCISSPHMRDILRYRKWRHVQ